ncbi:MAG: hypothetical protein R3D29_09665 [Nitratireductor sp.]
MAIFVLLAAWSFQGATLRPVGFVREALARPPSGCCWQLAQAFQLPSCWFSRTGCTRQAWNRQRNLPPVSASISFSHTLAGWRWGWTQRQATSRWLQ